MKVGQIRGTQALGRAMPGLLVLSALFFTSVAWAGPGSVGAGTAGSLSREPVAFGDAGPVSIGSPWSAYALSLVFQILLPILASTLVRTVEWMVGQRAPRRIHEIVGLAAWKAGCDCGFFLIQGPEWYRAFHPAGLIPYAIVQFFFLYVLGTLLIQEQILPFFAGDRPRTPFEEEVRRFVSRWFYEDADYRSTNATFSQVLTKPLLIMIAATFSWPIHDVGMNIAERSDNSVASVYWNYNFPLLWLFTLGGYFGKIFFFNCGWLGYRFVLWLLGRSEAELEAQALPEPESTPDEDIVSAKDIALPVAGMMNWKFATERGVGIVGVAWLLPFLATHLSGIWLPVPARSESPNVPVAPHSEDKESVHMPLAGKPFPIALEHADAPPRDRIGFRVERLLEAEEAGLVRLTIEGPAPIYYTTDGSIPALREGKPQGTTRQLGEPRQSLLFRDAAIVRAGREQDGRLIDVRTQAVVPNRWRVRLPKLPPSLSSIREVHVAGDFNDWSRDLKPMLRLMPDPDGSYSREILIDAGTRTYYKFQLKYDAGTPQWQLPQWHLSDDLPKGNDGSYVNHVVTELLRVAPQLRAENDGLLEEAGLSWERFQTDDEHERVALILPKGDVEAVWLKFPQKKIGEPLTAADRDQDGVPLVSYYGVIGCCANQAASGFCFLVKDRDHFWLVGPRGITSCGAADASQESALARMAAEGNAFECQTGPCADPSEDIRSRVVYFVMVDRFVDGNRKNNLSDNPDLFAATTSDDSAADAKGRNANLYWGGDLAGLTSKIEYLKSMGVGALWTSPLVRNIPWREELHLPHKAAYHGYWAYDFYDIDQRLGTWAELQQLRSELQTAQMEFILDFVPNHSSPAYMMEGGRLLKDGVEVVKSYAHDAQIKDRRQQFYHHYSMILTSDQALRAPDRYLRNPWLLADFNHGNPEVDRYLIEAAQLWVDRGATALRLDSLKHNDPDFLRRFCKAMNDYSLRKRGKPLYIVGEWFGGGLYDRASLDFVNRTDHCELLDFGLKYRLFDAMAGDGFESLDWMLQERRKAFRGRESWQMTFFDNHDTKRARVELGDPYYGRGLDAKLVPRRLDQGMVLLLTLPGIPVINYGTELYVGDSKRYWGDNDRGNDVVGDDPFNREMLPRGFEEVARTTPMFAIIQKLSALRRTSRAVQRAPYESVMKDQRGLVFQRADGKQTLVVAVNQGPARDVTLSGLKLPDGTYPDRLSPNSPDSPKLIVHDGQASLTLPEEGALVFHTEN